MDNKTLSIIVVAVLVVAAIGGAIALLGNGSGDDPVTEGVIYIGNGGKTSSGEDKSGLTSQTVSKNMFTYADHSFVKWNTKADGTGTSYAPGDAISYSPTVKLYAQWGYTLSTTFVTSGTSIPASIYLVDSSSHATYIGSNGAALPSDNKAAILFSGGEDWTFNSETSKFEGKFLKNDVTYTCTLKITFEGTIGEPEYKITNEFPSVLFQYNGPVDVTFSTKSTKAV